MLRFIEELSDLDKAAILAAMKEVRQEGNNAARHLSGEIYEVRADGERAIYRVLFAGEGEQSQALLALVAFKKKTQKTPPEQIRLAQRRLRDWRAGPRIGFTIASLIYHSRHDRMLGDGSTVSKHPARSGRTRRDDRQVHGGEP